MKRVAVITGGASGIGLGCAQRLAANGHSVAIFDLQTELVDQAVAELRITGADALGVTVDVSDRSGVDSAMTRVRAELGPVTIMVTSAGLSRSRSFTDMTSDEWERMLAVNLTGTFNCVQAAIGDMLDAGWGRIVTISSVAAQAGAPDRAHYAASKAGIVGLTKALSMEFAPRGITANTIPPSLIDTPMARDPATGGGDHVVAAVAAMTPVRRAGTANDVAAACAFLCSEDASFITGQLIGVNGGAYL
jgi:NAD(P)-dependent dehydrogenase (short-subunit alcohol dehydrogenase family)